jgi:uncharacterized protein (UPF0128 family)
MTTPFFEFYLFLMMQSKKCQPNKKMGGNLSSQIEVSETGMTPVANFISGMGIKLVSFDFDGVILAYKFSKSLDVSWTIEKYNKECKEKLVDFISRNISQNTKDLIVALMVNGVTIVISTHQDDKRNGELFQTEGDPPAFIFEGEELIKAVLFKSIGEQVSENIRIVSFSRKISKQKKRHFSLLVNDYKYSPREILVIDDNTEVVKQARENGFVAFFVQDHINGFEI